MRNFELYRRVLPSVGPIVFRNFFVLVNGIIFCVVVLLFAFGNPEAGLFLGVIFLLNTFIATAQDIHARVLLEKLQMLTALKVVRINPSTTLRTSPTETLVPAEEIVKGDLLKLKLGDQVPCDGVLISSNNLEISEALITGESDSFPKKENDKIVAGAIITSGDAVMEAQGLFRDSRLSKIAGEVKKYSTNLSSIQEATNIVIKDSGYILIAVLVFVVVRGILMHIPRLEIVTSSGALASTIVPQGLAVAITLLFAIGAASYARRNVLFQEINATEKLGRIKNICIDKTGTLTDNKLVVEDMHVVQGFNEEYARMLTSLCISSLSDSSETILAVKKYLENKNNNQDLEKIEVTQKMSFSSWRRFGGIEIKEKDILQSVFIGAPDIMLGEVSNTVEKKWLENIVEENSQLGKRVLCVARSSESGLPKDLKGLHLSIIAIFIFHNTLREGIQDAIKFFQDRGITIRVLSGDNLKTVAAVAKSVGINGADDVVTGQELDTWSQDDFRERAKKYTVFAQVLPEHKVKLVEAFKKDGFTAMVGDGVNDALAMKKSDIGIAMFDGVPVTRQLADVILMTNSFSDLPGAVELADHFIRSIEISSGIYINQSIAGLFLFIILSIFGYSFPFTPLNITFMNYFTVGFSTILISYWALRPSGKILPANDKPFLRRVLPVVFACGVVEAVGAALVFAFSPEYLKVAASNTLVGLALIIFGFFFLLFATNVYCGSITTKEKKQLLYLGVFELLVFYLALQVPFLINFFNITIPYPPVRFIGGALLLILIFIAVQYFLVKKFFLRKLA
ncbi:MAG: HAD-IC family P-type ATPase [Candidatus Pacebacteria bacterium]|nr:HAD-IC family P-type ATPase [Candidatus Paceibacterota bacterium]